jgi:hypothetical protein
MPDWRDQSRIPHDNVLVLAGPLKNDASAIAMTRGIPDIF